MIQRWIRQVRIHLIVSNIDKFIYKWIFLNWVHQDSERIKVHCCWAVGFSVSIQPAVLIEWRSYKNMLRWFWEIFRLKLFIFFLWRTHLLQLRRTLFCLSRYYGWTRWFFWADFFEDGNFFLLLWTRENIRTIWALTHSA